MFKILGRFAVAHPWTVCAAWLIGGLCLSWLAPAWDGKAQDDDIRFLPERCPSVRGYQLLSQAFPKDVFASRLLFAVERPDAVLGDADFTLVDRCVRDLEQLRPDAPELQLGKVVSYRDPLTGRRLTSNDRRCTLIEVSLGTPYLALQTRAAVDRADALLGDETGWPACGLKSSAGTEDVSPVCCVRGDETSSGSEASRTDMGLGAPTG